MREIVLSERAYHLRKLAVWELGVYSAFPEDEVSRNQALNLLHDEYSRWQNIGPEEYEPSKLTMTIIKSMQRPAARPYICGLVALSMCALRNAGHTMSLERAASIVSEYANNVDKMPFLFWDGGEFREGEKAITGDVQTIKRIFREYRSVAHICAANVAAADYLVPKRPFEEHPEADLCLIHTVLYYQNRLRAVANFSDWQLWEVIYSPPDNPAHYPILGISPEATRDLIEPWLSKQNF